ncbi:hypothetical protein [Streptomyces mirabilis]|uniref:hypothetical protein n=1 Tax=Streptomyces mirabilis TaxID=68239 RepID=UPI0036B734A5
MFYLKKLIAVPVSVALFYAYIVTATAAGLLVVIGLAANAAGAPLPVAAGVAVAGLATAACAVSVVRPAKQRLETWSTEIDAWADPPRRPAPARPPAVPPLAAFPAGVARERETVAHSYFPAGVFPSEPRELKSWELPDWTTCPRCEQIPAAGTLAYDTRTPLLVGKYVFTCAAGHSWPYETDGG